MSPRIATGGFFFINGAAIGSWAAHVPFVKDNLGISTGVLGLCLLAMGLGALVAMPIAGQFLDRHSSSSMTRIGAIAECTVLPLLILAPTPFTLALVMLWFGITNGVLDVSMNSHGVAIERQRTTPVMSSLHAGWSLGALAGAGAGALANGAGVDPLLQMSVVAALSLLTALTLGPQLGSATMASGTSRGFAMPSRAVLLIGLLLATVFLVEGALIDWLALYMKTDLGAGAGLAAAAYAAFSLGMASGRAAGDPMNRRLGAARLLRGGSATFAFVLAAILLFGEAALALPAFALAGLGLSNTVPLLFSAAGRVPNRSGPGPAVAAASTLAYAGLLLGPPLIGFVAAATSLTAALGLSAAMIGAVALLARRAAGRPIATAHAVQASEAVAPA